ncbi:zinc ribbon domain-containing protein [Christensenella sp. MSJ-20]|uniref:zinc ribbon domain-containing protein n=1 Tax=Christensenella sp. MSJ-20 TaxID=2841518 RepID=UPI000D78D4C0|nr:MAG: hypothetical protein DBY42_05345 [Bacillota bacterium]QWT55052.1 zinc ribbon domain-containing protein [Christensenella sp. MSJ-20]
MDSLKQYRKAIDLAVYGVALLCTLLFAVYSVWGFGISGFTILFEASFIGGLLLILAPVMGIVLELVLAKNMDERTQMIVNLVICIAGVLLLFIAKGIAAGEGASLVGLGFGGILSLIAYLAGGILNGLFLFGGNLGSPASSGAVCPNCGKPVAPGKAFCSNCGQKLK